MGNAGIQNNVCLVAIVKDEEPFLDEWLLYHQMIGIDHFFIYDDDPRFELAAFLQPHEAYTTVVNWHGKDRNYAGRNNQTKAYWHAVQKHIAPFEWVVFLDADEFLVFNGLDNINTFLAKFDEEVTCISLNWHVFGHNGYYDDPEGLITAALTKRMKMPGKMIKSINRSIAISIIDTAHLARLKFGLHVDANNQPYSDELYPGKTMRAHVNHYQCRSFKRWMRRVSRGDVSFDPENSPASEKWRLTEEACLRQFVTTIALNKNEMTDGYMLKFSDWLKEKISLVKKKRNGAL